MDPNGREETDSSQSYDGVVMLFMGNRPMLPNDDTISHPQTERESTVKMLIMDLTVLVLMLVIVVLILVDGWDSTPAKPNAI